MGGKDECCAEHIFASDRSCFLEDAPCIMNDAVEDELHEGESAGEWTIWDSLNIVAAITLFVGVCVCCYVVIKRRRTCTEGQVVTLMDDEAEGSIDVIDGVGGH